MDDTPELERFRAEAAIWLESQLAGPFRDIRGLNNHVDLIERRRDWEQCLGAAGWSCVGWPAAYGGRDASIAQQVVFAEEYARARAPARIGHIGVELAGPTLLAFGTPAQKKRFLPDIAAGRAIWCQGYSEPNAGSDLANVRTKARRDGERYIIDGQKIWTSMGQIADWCFVLCRTEPGSVGNKGLSFLLVNMHQPGVTVRPIRQMTGESEFSEVFFDGALAEVRDLVGAEGDGWRVAMGLLGFERGVSTLAQQMQFRNELDALIELAKENGKAADPLIRQRLAQAQIGLRIMRFNALRLLANAESGQLSPEGYTYKLYWSTWHRNLGELVMDVAGPAAEIGETAERFPPLTTMFLMSRADTIYAGTNQIQRNIIAERALGLPREARGP
ncbi:alkylation response protein AidB-like acyl-CoA dehydrogenase [Nitrospirillum amazonense]|uniref:Alkylation response protein AidB-like acyl-CoA dehydrogenase n=1 Tax=Nitrospirillum amazonense TaxID=28077 RepID=A0A560J6L0_9PROT|nr:acyl-CoA dehydrogenase family protein [Nitrospirillum amazonense]TWB66099.1 alkylation response protein AidB-like acyl-CoA dehydrogenase [Nitrospirillum amazonense]